MTASRRVSIIGGGASGALVAARLLRDTDAQVTLIEPASEPGLGMAYSTGCSRHLLNVTAGKMSAFPEDASHFVRWLGANGLTQYGECSFVPRMIFGEYLNDVLREARAGAAEARFEHRRERAESLDADAGGIRIGLSGGGSVSGDRCVLALGNAAPAPWPGLAPEVANGGRFFGIAWDRKAMRPSDPDETVLLLGTGLTAVDAVLELRHNGHRGKIIMLSRRGVLPMRHELYDCEPLGCPGAETARDLMRNLRVSGHDAEILYGNWRIAVDGVRAETNVLWRKLPQAEQKRFLRHVRTYWDAHRHRMAPEIAGFLASEIENGGVSVCAGRAGKMEATANGLRATVRPRGGTVDETLDVGRVINCTGPEANLARRPNGLIRDLIGKGYLRPHPLGAGAMADEDGALEGRDDLFTIGPLRFGSLLETVAIPEIREQARDLAVRLTMPRRESFARRNPEPADRCTVSIANR